MPWNVAVVCAIALTAAVLMPWWGAALLVAWVCAILLIARTRRHIS
jgi:uncharacterized iron-regulated membrane protein